MEAPEHHRDYVSNLHQELQITIFSGLSTKDAVDACILVSPWHRTWCLIPEVTIKKGDFERTSATAVPPRSRFVRFVDGVLNLHHGPIIKFHLDTGSAYLDKIFQESLQRWLGILSRRVEFQELILCYTRFSRLPPSLFACCKLKILKIFECKLELPQGFEGFKLMQQLELHECIIGGDDFFRLVASSPALNELVVQTGVFVIYNARITAPSLKVLTLHGRFSNLHLEASSILTADISNEAGMGSAALGPLPQVQCMRLRGYFLQCIAQGFPARLPSTLNSLTILEIETDLVCHAESRFIGLLLESAPYLERLTLVSTHRVATLTADGPWKLQPSYSTRVCSRLRVIRLDNFIKSVPGIAFIKFVVGIAPLLQTLAINWETGLDHNGKQVVIRAIEQMPKASTNLQLYFE